KLADDPDVKVRFQLACSLGEWKTAEAGHALAKLAMKDAGDPFFAAAIMSSAVPHHGALAAALSHVKNPWVSPIYDELLALCLALEDRNAMVDLLGPILIDSGARRDAAAMAALARLLDSLPTLSTSVDQLMSRQSGDAFAGLLG